MDRVMKTNKNWQWVLFIIMGIAIFVLYTYNEKKIKRYKEELEYLQTLAIRDSVRLRKAIRDKEDEAFLYRDSLRQQKIDYILLQNEKSQKQIRDVIRILPNSDTKFRDSLWSDEWAKQDSATY